MNAKSLMIGVVVGVLLGGVAVAAAGSWGFTFGRFVTARTGMSAGTLAQDGMFHSQSDGTRDQFSGANSSGTETFTVDKDGDVVLGRALFPEVEASDPCPTFGPGAVFMNASYELCYCDASTDDIKAVDNSTACY